MPPLLASAAGEFLLERVQVRRPEAPKSSDPEIEFPQGLRVHRVESPGALRPHARQAALAQDTKVHRNPGLRDAELALDDGGDSTRRLLALREKLQYPTADWIANHVESLHAPNISVTTYISKSCT